MSKYCKKMDFFVLDYWHNHIHFFGYTKLLSNPKTLHILNEKFFVSKVETHICYINVSLHSPNQTCQNQRFLRKYRNLRKGVPKYFQK